MKKLFILFSLINLLLNSPFGGWGAFAQNTLIEPSNLQLPRLTSNEILAILSPQKGMMVFETDTKCVKYFNGSEWICTSSTKGIVPSNQSAKRMGNTTNDDVGVCLATDAAGNIYLAGDFWATATYGSYNFTSYDYVLQESSSGVFILKLSPDGSIIWAASESGSNLIDLEVDAYGNVYLAYFHQYATAPDNIVHENRIKRLNANGTFGWSINYADVIQPKDLGVTNGLMVYVTGVYNSNFSFHTTTLNSIGLDDIFILKLSSVDGSEIWAKRVGGIANDRPTSLETSGENFILTGSTDGSANFGNDATTHNVLATLYNDAFIVKYDSDGNVLWHNRVGGYSDDIGRDVAIDSQGNVYLAGTYGGTQLTVDNHTLTAEDPEGSGRAIFIAKFTSNGVLVWVNHAGRTNIDNNTFINISANNSGNCFVAGSYQKCVSFGNDELTTVGKSDVFIAKYDSEGKVDWVTRGGGANDDFALGILTISNKTYITGAFKLSATFGGVQLTTTTTNYQRGLYLYKITE